MSSHSRVTLLFLYYTVGVKNIIMISHKRNDTTNNYLEDAEKAGGVESRRCTFVLCEGVSAAIFVVSTLFNACILLWEILYIPRRSSSRH